MIFVKKIMAYLDGSTCKLLPTWHQGRMKVVALDRGRWRCIDSDRAKYSLRRVYNQLHYCSNTSCNFPVFFLV